MFSALSLLGYFVAPKGADDEYGCLLLEKQRSLFLLGLLGQEHSLDVGQYTSLGNGDTREELVQLFIVTDGELKMTGDDPRLLVVTSSIASQLEHLSCEVFHHSSQVDWGTSTNSLGIVALAEKTVDTTNGELESSPAAAGL